MHVSTGASRQQWGKVVGGYGGGLIDKENPVEVTSRREDSVGTEQLSLPTYDTRALYSPFDFTHNTTGSDFNETDIVICFPCTAYCYNTASVWVHVLLLLRAHLRQKSDDIDKKQKSEGGWPSMSVLKHWMMQVEEPSLDYIPMDEERNFNSNRSGYMNHDMLADRGASGIPENTLESITAKLPSVRAAS
ncbi:hypothetical protein ACMFMF_003664 [Clarireedia jacksonii]